MANILIVEDDRILSNAYKMILTKDRHQVRVAYDGQEALDKLTQSEPDIILLDLLMPGVGGIEFLERYRTLAPATQAQVVVLSNMGDAALVKQARSLGAEKYIVKAHTTPGQLSLMVKRMSNKRATSNT